ncbi:H+/Cl-antiporter ClcA [Thiomonas bhubaneswarensis]|uniref:H+/Cl-antiporter ClcA n=1 Tax=Thiomonas bhubaneswarensis TaxID=339866 RepID=A0A0K6I8P4_9BURK|nr:H+/Cl-antiporter ClcA [Thiomonas bhubaneswarensis]
MALSKPTTARPEEYSLDVPLQSAHIGTHSSGVNRRTLFICLLAIGVGVIASFIAQALLALIGLITHLAFQGRIGWTLTDPAHNSLGAWVIAVPVVGALIVGFMARYGSPAIRGHGIPEAMEQILLNRSRIPLRVLILKPLSAAISIGTGGPFGAEGPIIATGGALGSVLGQWIPLTPDERKVLLAAGAAAGMTAVFGTPLASVALAIELLLFEYRPASFLPVLLACGAAAVTRAIFDGFTPFFSIPPLALPHAGAIFACLPLGAVVGLVAVLITRAVYAVEDAFEHLPLHWMWWPALGAVAVGLIGWWQPRTLGVGYGNITDALSGTVLVGSALWLLGAAKLVSWTIALGSGTSGGTLAPLMTVGACLGAALGHAVAALFPQIGLSPELAALVGMAAVFAGASRALFMSVLFALETTWQMPALLPLLIGCGAAYLVSILLMPQTIMTEKIARRGVRVPTDYTADLFSQALVRDHASHAPITLRATQTVAQVRAWLEVDADGSRHQGYAVLDEVDHIVGVVTRKDVFRSGTNPAQPLSSLITRRPLCVHPQNTLAEALRLMTVEDIGRLPVVSGANGSRVIGMLTRSDLLKAWRERHLDQTVMGR